MTSRESAKADLLAALEGMNDMGGVSEDGFAEMNARVDALLPFTPVPNPAENAQLVEGPWENVFAHFGAAHSAGKTRVHDSSLKIHSFSNFPDIPIRVTQMRQEIDQETKDYNNVVSFTVRDGTVKAVIIVFGRYAPVEAEPLRFNVGFYRVELRSEDGRSDAELREALGLEADAPLIRDFKPPRLHSDVVYVDEDLRINKGNFGGLYILRRLDAAGQSINWPRPRAA